MVTYNTDFLTIAKKMSYFEKCISNAMIRDKHVSFIKQSCSIGYTNHDDFCYITYIYKYVNNDITASIFISFVLGDEVNTEPEYDDIEIILMHQKPEITEEDFATIYDIKTTILKYMNDFWYNVSLLTIDNYILSQYDKDDDKNEVTEL